ncbi:CG8478 [Drosophila busckii]|uniref:CG8478 n=1 Tax=Drosophila busckii TaxID=30019 RepID=A0A0M3QXV8_DROBS|nr:uncharacterized protein LOC108602040 [Drosophila busckii]ALC46549.1 CG8478 [Drosophila busckii]
MENSRRSVCATEDSVASMYLSFDDTLASKWESVVTSQTSHYLEINATDMNTTLEDQKVIEKTVLKSLIKDNTITDQASPLRPFDMSLLNKHNGLSSTPTKNNTLKDQVQKDVNNTDIDDKENTQPDGENSTLSSTIDATTSTVKTNTMFHEGNSTIGDVSTQDNKNKNNVYPLCADVLLENITEVSNEEPSMQAASPAIVLEEKKDVDEMVNEVSNLIAKALTLKEAAKNPKEVPKATRQLPVANMPRPRRSFLPTVGGTQTLKQRMSIVVKTTLNSPARKLAANSAAAARRSYLPVGKITQGGVVGNRKSLLPRTAETKPSSTAAPAKPIIPKQQPKDRVDAPKFNCKLCSVSFSIKSSLDLHMRSHQPIEPANKGGARKISNCKYCDKKFALERALHIHLMQNCVKIPPKEKRKLEFTELNHQKKAQLPKLTGVESFGARPRESLMPKNFAQSEVPPMAPPSTKKVIKKAHTGVSRTPTKTVPCHICKQSFKSILEYTNHCLSVHSRSKEQQETAKALTALLE